MPDFTCISCGQVFRCDDHRGRSQCYICLPPFSPSTMSAVLDSYMSGKSLRHISVSLCLPLGRVRAAVFSHVPLRRPEFNSVSLNLDFLDGWLAGDGSLSLRSSGSNARADHSSSKPGYTDYIRGRFLAMGFSVGAVYSYLGSSNTPCHSFHSHVHPSLTHQRMRWYPSGKKLFPSDFRVSPDSLREWYLGDGTLENGRTPVLVVYSPTVPDIEKLVATLASQFGDVRLGRRSHPDLRDIRFCRDSSQAFFSYVGPCPVPDYAYRWPSIQLFP